MQATRGGERECRWRDAGTTARLEMFDLLRKRNLHNEVVVVPYKEFGSLALFPIVLSESIRCAHSCSFSAFPQSFLSVGLR